MGMSKCPGVHESLVLVGLWTEAPNSLHSCVDSMGVVMSVTHRVVAWQSGGVSP